MRKIRYLLLIIIIIYSTFGKKLLAEAEWTVLVYMAADNNLSQSAFKDINEMETVQYSDSLQVIVQVDPNDNLSYPPYFSEARRYYITHDENTDSLGSELLQNLGEINSASPEELSSFVNWGFSQYKSRKKMLIIWDHGNGWRESNDYSVKSLCYDNSNNDRMSVAEGELSQAVANFDETLDILIFDACLMQMVEVVAEIYDYCNIVMGCEMDVPSDGIFYGDYDWNPDSQYGLFNYMSDYPTVKERQLASEIVSRYIGSYVSGVQTGGNTTMSAVDCRKFADLLQPALHEFSLNYADTSYFTTLHNAYDLCHPINSDKYVDCWQFFHKLSNAGTDSINILAEEVTNVIDSTIIKSLAYVNNTIDNQLGRLSINLPKYKQNFSNWQLYGELSFVKKSRWDRFIAFFHKGYPNSSSAPVIEDFSVNAKSEYIQVSWNALAPTFITYEVDINENIKTEFSVSAVKSRFNYFDTTLSQGIYDFKLTAADEFGNFQDSTRVIEVKEESFFSFYPNPFKVKNFNSGWFLFDCNKDDAFDIKIYNQAGEFVEKISANSRDNSIKKIEYNAAKLASGIYYCLLSCGDSVRKIKLAIIR